MKAINLKKIIIASAALIGLGAAAITTINQAEPTTVQAATGKIKVSQSSAVKKFQAKYNAKKMVAMFMKLKDLAQLENTK